MLLSSLVVIALGLTITMFAKRESMLGFPSVIFWAILGGYAYTESTATWDLYYLFFFGAMGMVIFCAIGAWAVREKRDSIGDESMEKEDKFIDEEQPKDDTFDLESDKKPTKRTENLRERAKRRREK